ncbi:MAG: YkgJ family cysteine cluster protein [Cyanobacteria bacterium HKST-UBA06]|nr:YkgJ family cysteine cluster protein [Cyanobacteria bacterium HKST-UBA06]
MDHGDVKSVMKSVMNLVMKPDVAEAAKQIFDVLDRHVAGLAQRYADQMACRKGCWSCCRDTFSISLVEGVILLEGLVVLAQTNRQRAQKVLEQLQAPPTGYCPLLIDGACSVYAYRPVVCRAYGLLVKAKAQISSCLLNFNRLADDEIAVLELDPFNALMEELSARQCPESEGTARRSIPAWLAALGAVDHVSSSLSSGPSRR